MWTEAQRRRARAHAALGEPIRLAIAELLSSGDRSPKELADEFELPTNLVAHHLAVMEDAGLVRRRRSEGDARRSYIQLRLDEPLVAALTPTQLPGRRVGRVLFVCTANSARSQLAAARWQQLSKIPAASAGTHPAARVHPRAVSVGRRHRLRLAGQRTVHLADVVRRSDLLVAVCDQAHEELVAAPGSTGAKAGGTADPLAVLHWSVPDPVRVGTDAAFEAAFAEISARVERLAHRMTALAQTTSRNVEEAR